MECHSKAKGLKEPKAKVETFTSLDRAGKNIIDQNGPRHSAVLDLVAASDGTTFNHTVYHITMSAHSQIKLKMQCPKVQILRDYETGEIGGCTRDGRGGGRICQGTFWIILPL
jgi:hypothetical protein